jgi:hypothetical protein
MTHPSALLHSSNKKPRPRLIRAIRIGALTSLGVLLGSCCWEDSVEVGLIIGTPTGRWDNVGASEVHFCPGDMLTLNWATHGDFKKARISGIGTVSLPGGQTGVQPTQTTEYKLQCSYEDCDKEDTATATLIKDGDKVQIGAQLVNAQDPTTGLPVYYWENTLTADAWSPQAQVTSMRMIQFPANQTNADIWNDSRAWAMTKTEATGQVRSFLFGWVPATPWTGEMGVLGKYHFTPTAGGSYPNQNLPIYANIEVTLACKKK